MAKRARLRAVLLDFDGTLVSLPTDYQAMRGALSSLFLRYGITSASRSILDSIKMGKDQLRARGESATMVETFVKEARGVIQGFELAAVPKAVASDGAREFLLALRGANLLIGIVTNNARETVLRVVAQCGLPAPDVVVGLGDTTLFKPDPEPAIAALAALGVPPESAVVIGDDDRDRIMAERAGISVLLVSPEIPGFPSLDKLFDSVRARS